MAKRLYEIVVRYPSTVEIPGKVISESGGMFRVRLFPRKNRIEERIIPASQLIAIMSKGSATALLLHSPNVVVRKFYSSKIKIDGQFLNFVDDDGNAQRLNRDHVHVSRRLTEADCLELDTAREMAGTRKSLKAKKVKFKTSSDTITSNKQSGGDYAL